MHNEIGMTLIGKAWLPDLIQARLPTKVANHINEIGLTLIGKVWLPDLSQARLPTTLMNLMLFNAARH